jgi:uncharacterized repeat protein (TIGR01451 family)
MRISKTQLIGAFYLCGGLSGLATASEPITNTLTVHRVVAESGGLEKAVSAATAKPGDTLEYVVELHNGGGAAVNGLSATLPLPAGTELIPGSERPSKALASLDGSTFSPMPLKRAVKRADGAIVDELVPPSEYRFLRWNSPDLPANATLHYSARVSVSKSPAGK